MKDRRAISTVVGGFFFVIAFTSTIGYVFYSMNMLDNFGEAVLVKNEEKMDREREQFEIVHVTRDNNKFNVTLQNTGNLPIVFTRLWIENITSTSDTNRIFKFDINKTANPGETVTKIGQSLPVFALPTQAYDLKVLTKRGNEQEVSVNSASQAPLYMQLYALPSSVPTKFPTTLLLAVTNNMTNKNVLLNLKPNSAFANSIDKTTNCPSGICTYTYLSGPDPPYYPSLRAGDTAYFRWTYQLDGSNNDKVTFTASLENGISANTASATVTVSDVQTALVAGSSIESAGVTTPDNPKDILILHQETAGTPQGRYQMYSGDAEQTGTTISVRNVSPKFFTNNGTVVTTISPGVWNASLRYYSAPLPPSLVGQGEGMIHHFEESSGNPDDSSPNNNDLTKCGGGKSPTWSSSSGPNGTGTFQFSGGQCLKDTALGNGILLGNEPDTTAFWFKYVGQLPNTKQILLRWEDPGGPSDFYEISIAGGGADQGKVIFSYDKGSGLSATCKSPNNSIVSDHQWHHIVAVRAAPNQPPGNLLPDTCYLYVDGVQVSTNHNTNVGNNSIDVTDLHIGSTSQEASPGFYTGYIDDIIHWDNKALSATEAFDLYKTSYGTGAHKLNFVISKTDQNGVLIQPIIKTTTNYPFKFVDGKQFSDNTDSKFARFNYTVSIPQVSLALGNRLNFSAAYSSGLDMNLRIDDSSMLNPKTSFLQTGVPDNPFASYVSYSRSGELEFFARNSGPYGSWMTYQGTRVVLDSLTGITSYAGLIHTINGTTLNQDTDSIFIPVNSIADMKFYQPQSNPKRIVSQPDVVPVGNYQMSVFINGYDETGKVFLRTLNVGLVNVIP